MSQSVRHWEPIRNLSGPSITASRDVVERQYGPFSDAEQDKLFDAAWEPTAHEIILGDNLACGYCSIEDRDAEIVVHELVIEVGFQGRGIGTKILRTVTDVAQSHRTPVRLQTHIVNRAAELYRRVGFQERGRTNTHILMEWRPIE